MALFLEEYEKLRLLGKGSFASVYKVRHHRLGYVRAIKVSNDLITDENDPAYQTFLNECRVLLNIGNGSHPNIIRIYQPRLIANKAIVEMDFVDGLTLTEYMKKSPFISMDEFRRFAREIVGAMAYCHADLYKFLMDPDADNLVPDPADGSRWLIDSEKEAELREKYCVNHNDLHSNNIMRRNYDGSFVILDFGLAIQDNHCVKSSSRGDGAYEYCSPEKLDGKEITSASDVYSLGILLYELLAGQVPFVMDVASDGLEKARYDVYMKHLHEHPAPILPLRRKAFERSHPGEVYMPDIPAGLEDVVMKCLSKKPSDRYRDASELLRDLETVLFAENSFSGSAVPDPSEIAGELADTRNRLIDVQRENESLRERLKYISSAPTPVKKNEKGSKNPLWILSLVFAAASLIAGCYLTMTTDYWLMSDKSYEINVDCAAGLSVILVLVAGFVKRRRMLMASLALLSLVLSTAFMFAWPPEGAFRWLIASLSAAGAVTFGLFTYFWYRK